MQFHEYHTVYELAKHDRIGGNEGFVEFYKCRMADAVRDRSRVAITQFGMEFNWLKSKKPYYNIWPSIVAPLLKLNLAIDASMMIPPIPELCIRLPVDNNPMKFEFGGERYEICCMMMSRAEVRGQCGVCLWIDIGETIRTVEGDFTYPVYTYQNFICAKGKSLEDEILSLPKRAYADVGIILPQKTLLDCVRLACCLCLLEQDPEIITADVLNTDRAKFEATGDQKYIDKAYRRGKVGWNIGRKLEVSPHVRIAHTALYWTGLGRTVPRIIFRKGSIIHRKVIEKIPTGYGGDVC